MGLNKIGLSLIRKGIADRIHKAFFVQKILPKKLENCRLKLPPPIENDVVQITKKDFTPDMFMIKMLGYANNQVWGRRMADAATKTSEKIVQGETFQNILNYVEQNTHDINLDCFGKTNYGNYKMLIGSFDIYNPNDRGGEYFKRYIGLCNGGKDFICKANKEYNHALTCKIHVEDPLCPVFVVKVNYGSRFLQEDNITDKYDSINLKLAEKAYNNLKAMKKSTKQDAVDTAATIQWLIAQESPYQKGSDSIATLLSRSLMHSYGCKLSPLKAGISCDFEAFCTHLDDYIKNYPTFFEINPTL